MARPDQVPTPYTFQAWPSWRYGPEGEAEIFQSEDEVPEGWEDHPNKFNKAKPRAKKVSDEDAATEAAAKVKALEDDNTAADLITMLKAMQKKDSAIEFSESWPKLKLAQTIVAAEKKA